MERSVMRSLVAVCMAMLFGMLSMVLAQDEGPIFTLPYDDFPEEPSEFTRFQLYGASISPDSTRIAITGDMTLAVYDLNSGEMLYTRPAATMFPGEEGVRWSPDGGYMLAFSTVVDGFTGEPVLDANIQNAGARWLGNDGSLLLHLESSRDTPIRNTIIRDIAAGTTVLTLEAEAIGMSADESLIVTMRLNEQDDQRQFAFEWWDRNGQMQHSMIDESMTFVPSLSPDAMKLIFFSYDTYDVMDVRDGREILSYADPMGITQDSGCGMEFPAVAWSSNSNRVLIGTRIYDANSGAIIAELDASRINEAHWSADGARIITAGNPGGIWDANSGALLAELPGAYHMVRWGRDEGVIFAHTDNRVSIYDAGGGLLLEADHTAEDIHSCRTAPAISPDGAHFVTWGDLTGFELAPGGRALVYVEDDGLNLRTGTGTDFEIIEKLPRFSYVDVLDGPQEASGFVWWQVRSAAGNTGWVVESADNIATLSASPVQMENGVLNVWRVPGS